MGRSATGKKCLAFNNMSSELIGAVSAERAWSVKVWAAEFKAIQFPVGVWNCILSNQGWSETWAPVQTDFFFFCLVRVWRTF